MTDHSQAAHVGELSQAVANLTEALARTEKRSARLSRIIRWSLLGGLVLLVIAGFLIAKSFNRFLSNVEEAIIQNKDVQEHFELSIKKTIAKDNLDDKKRQLTPEAYKTFVDNLVLEEYKTFVVNLTQEMTLEEYNAFVRNLALGQDNLPLKTTKQIIETIARTLSPDRYKTLLVEALARTISSEESKAFIETPSPEHRGAIARQVAVDRTIKVLADIFVVLGRVRDDSNKIHKVLHDGFKRLVVRSRMIA